MSAPCNQESFFLGIDVGGTDVKVGLIREDGSIAVRDRRSTPELGTPIAVFEYALEFGRQEALAARGVLKACGLAVPGVLDATAYTLREVVNLPGWLGVPLLDQLSGVADLPSIVVNDANAAAFAEHSIRGLGEQSLGLVTLGTGVGCGLVVAGDPCGGDHGCAGELGHITVDFSENALPCTCGSRGHLETYVGAAGVVKRTQERFSLTNSPPPWGERAITPLDISKLANSGDETCLAVIDETAVLLGRAIGLLGQTVDPAVVLLGGAMTFGGAGSKVGERFIHAVRESVRATTLVQVGENIKIEFATLGNDAGMIGAGVLASSFLS